MSDDYEAQLRFMLSEEGSSYAEPIADDLRESVEKPLEQRHGGSLKRVLENRFGLSPSRRKLFENLLIFGAAAAGVGGLPVTALSYLTAKEDHEDNVKAKAQELASRAAANLVVTDRFASHVAGLPYTVTDPSLDYPLTFTGAEQA